MSSISQQNNNDASLQLKQAIRQNSKDAIAEFRAAYPDFNINELDVEETTPLIFAIKECGGLSLCIESLHAIFPTINPNIIDYEGKTAMYYAILLDNSPAIRTLSDCFGSYLDINTKLYYNNTALLIAVSFERAECLKTLIQSFSTTLDPDVADNDGDTALFIAISRGRTDLIDILYQYYPHMNPNKVNKAGQNALILAVNSGSVDCLQTIYTYFPSIEYNKQSSRGMTAFMSAIKHLQGRPSWLPMCQQLCLCFPQMDFNLQNHLGQTALMIALEYCTDDETVILSLFPSSSNCAGAGDRHPVNINLKDKKGNTALSYAAKHAKFRMIYALHSFWPNDLHNNKPDESPIASALYNTVFEYSKRCNADPTRVIKTIAALHDCYPNMDPNPDEQFHSPLVVAIRIGSAPIVRALYQHFPNIIINTPRANPFLRAVKSSSQEVFLATVQFPNIDPSILSHTGKTALMLALSTLDPSRFVQLYKRFPTLDPNAQNPNNGYNALMFSLENNVQFTMQHIKLFASTFPTFNINAQSKNGLSAFKMMFMHSSDRDWERIARFQKAFRDVDPNIQDKYGETPLMFVSNLSRLQTIRELLRCFPHIDLSCRDIKGWTVFHVAALLNQPNVLHILLTFIMKQADTDEQHSCVIV